LLPIVGQAAGVRFAAAQASALSFPAAMPTSHHCWLSSVMNYLPLADETHSVDFCEKTGRAEQSGE
jgi:hypothetical protein